MTKVLSKEQVKLLSLVERFKNDYVLVGGTAIALQLKHRQSIDFDLFIDQVLKTDQIKRIIREKNKIDKLYVESKDELTMVVDKVKMTFYNYPFKLKGVVGYKKIIMMPSLVVLGAMKAYALGRRAKWKDYVDLYYIFKTLSFSKVVGKAKQMFKGEFSEKLFREQLCYYRDVEKGEKLVFLPGFKKSQKEIEDGLKKLAIS